MKILDNTKSLSTLVSDTSNGLGQIQPLTCVVTEELNGIYELDFTVNVNDRHYADLKNSGLVKVTVGDGSEQIFRIYKIDEPINMISSVHCQHITYDLSKVVVKPFTATGAVNIKNQLVSNMLGSYPFSTWTDISNTTSTFTNDIPRYFRECLGGYEGSVLDVLRPEYEWDNLTVKLHARRGSDNGVRISYGKNLIDYSQEQNNENVYDGVYGYAVVDEVTYKADSYYNKTGATYPRILNVDFSSDYESGQIPTPSELLQKATTYAQNNSIEVPSINIKIDFIPLWQTEEYKNILPLERVSLGDTVHVYFDKLNVEASSRVIKTQWNVLTQKYDSIELGDAKANLNTIITDSVSTAVDDAVSQLDIDTSYIESKLDNITSLIANGLGLRVSTDSQGRIILHNEETIANSQYQYMITSQGFMMSNDYGQTWNSGWTTSGDAVVNSLATIVLNALEINGSTINGTIINFGDLSDKYITAQSYDGDNDGRYDGVSFDGNGYVRFQPTELFSVRNLASDGTNAYNTFSMSKGTTSPQIYLINYDDTHNYLYANWIALVAHTSNSGGTIFNQLRVANDATASGTRYNANMLLMEGFETSNHLYLRNFKTGASRYGNFVQLDADATTLTASIGNHGFTSTSSSSYANRLLMTTTASQSRTRLINNDPTLNTSANEYEMNTTATSRYSNLFNYDFNTYTSSSGNLGRGQANRIYMSSSSSTNELSLYNNITITSGEISANQLIMTSASSMNRYSLYNNKANDTGSANSIMMIGTPLGGGMTNSISINNYDVDGNNLSDTLYMGKSSSDNTVYLRINRGGNNVGEVKLNRDSSGLVTIGMYVRGGSYGYSSASFEINSNGQAKINGNTLNFSGGYVRY